MTDDIAFAQLDERRVQYELDVAHLGTRMVERLLVKGPENGAGPDGVAYRREGTPVEYAQRAAMAIDKLIFWCEKLQDGDSVPVGEDVAERIARHAADAANFAMMASHPDRLGMARD